jgi:SanA protein
MMKSCLYGFWALILIVLALTLGVDFYVTQQTIPKTYNDVAKIPRRKVGLLLGCSRYAANGQISTFYGNRIDAAVKLYKAGKVDFILASGDNRTPHYNEPKWMHDDLVKRGVPANKIYMDYAGLRTLDSVVRCSRVFGENKITVISQAFHNQRAIFIARYWKIDAIGFNAEDVNSNSGTTVLIREKLARVLMMIDLLTGKQPKHYGDKVIIK